MILVQATETDIDDYISLENKLKSRTYSTITDREGVLGELKKGPVYLMKENGLSVGMVSYQIKADGSAYISGLTVDPAYQGKGFARAALTQVLSEVKDAPKVTLHTHPDNVKSLGLYTSLGFKVGKRIENYFGDGEPRVELTLLR